MHEGTTMQARFTRRRLGTITLGAAGAVFVTALIGHGATEAVRAADAPATCPPPPRVGAAASGGTFAAPARVTGKITAISGGTLTVQTGDGSTRTVTADGQTRVTNTASIALGDLRAGEMVMVAGDRTAANAYTAKSIAALSVVNGAGDVVFGGANGAPPPGTPPSGAPSGPPSGDVLLSTGPGFGGGMTMPLPAGCAPGGQMVKLPFDGDRPDGGIGGSVVGVSGSTLTLQGGDAATVAVTVGANTTVTRQVGAALTDLKVGDNVVALGRPGTDASAAAFVAGLVEGRGSLPVDVQTLP